MVLGKHNAGSALGVRSSRIEEEEKRQRAVTKIITRTNPFHPDDTDPEIISEKWVPQLED
ncbi:hypothetical protein [Methanocalculus natronophilus]|uniref:hypothetical protein n=1 Tax=Methanocalculus natronophilus TaxID=1262400 RepID=UPI0031B5A79A